MTDAVVAEGLVRAYGPVRALDGLDLRVARGTVSAVLGPNGAGKTTATRVLATLTLPDAGRGGVLGHEVVRAVRAVRRSIGLAG
jgi:ABC-2 type transport system ATP-binding protein